MAMWRSQKQLEQSTWPTKRTPSPALLHTGGVFLLVGYSSTDESLLRPHTNLGVQDAVRALQQYMVQHINNQVSIVPLRRLHRWHQQ